MRRHHLVACHQIYWTWWFRNNRALLGQTIIPIPRLRVNVMLQRHSSGEWCKNFVDFRLVALYLLSMYHGCWKFITQCHMSRSHSIGRGSTWAEVRACVPFQMSGRMVFKKTFVLSPLPEQDIGSAEAATTGVHIHRHGFYYSCLSKLSDRFWFGGVFEELVIAKNLLLDRCAAGRLRLELRGDHIKELGVL